MISETHCLAKKAMAVIAAAFALCASADIGSLVVPAGETLTVTSSATYDTVTVNGTLIVSAGTLTATNAFRIADGAGATGTLIVTNSATIASAEGTLAVGVNGGSGLVSVCSWNNVCRFVELGEGGGASTIRYVSGSRIQSRYVTKKGSGTCRLEFMGGAVATGMQASFYIEEGELTLASIDGADISVMCASNNAGDHKLLASSGSGVMTTEGTGRFAFMIESYPTTMQLLVLDSSSRITWGHSGGFAFTGASDMKFLKANSPTCFDVGGAPAAVHLEGGWLDVNGARVAVKDLSGSGGVTNRAASAGAVVLGGDGEDHSLNGAWKWDFKTPLCKVGAGTLTYSGASFPGRVLVSNGLFRVSARHDVVYSHYRFVIDDCIGTAHDSMQLSEFRLLCGGQDVTSLRSGYTFGEGADDREASNQQGPGRALDGTFTTKWLTFKTGKYNAEETYKTNCWIQVDFASPRAISDYDWGTGNDWSYDQVGSRCRDPMKWRLLGSDDGETWTELDSRDIGRRNLARSAWTGPYSAMGSDEIAVGAISVAGGVFEVLGNIASSSIDQTGGQVRIGETGCVRLVNGDWLNPSFTADSAGTVVSDSTGTNRMNAASADFPCKVSVSSGTLAFARKLKEATLHRLFRFTIKKAHSATDCTQISRLTLFDASGNILSAGLSAARAGTSPASLEAGKCAYAANYAQGGSSSVANLFDENTSTKMCLTSLSMTDASDSSKWRVVHFRLSADATAPAVAYRMTTANDNTPARNPVIWTLEGSSDGGATWELLDSRSPGEFVNPTKTYTDYNGGVPFALRNAIMFDDIASAEVASMVISSGASAWARGTAIASHALEVDCALGGGTLESLEPAEGGALYLLNVPANASFNPYDIPLAVGSVVNPENLNTWTVYVNGTPKRSMKVGASANGLHVTRKGLCIIVF